MNSWALTAYYKKNHNQNKTQTNNNHQKRVLDSALFPVKIFLQYHPSILQPDTGKKPITKKEMNPGEKQGISLIEKD